MPSTNEPKTENVKDIERRVLSEYKQTDEYKTLQYLQKHNLSLSEVKQLAKGTTRYKPNTRQQHKHVSRAKHTRIGVMSDIHYGHRMFREDVFYDALERFNKSDIDCVYCPGDLIEGMSNRDGHIYELAEVGVSNQLDGITKLLSELEKPFRFVLGNHDLWSMKKGNQGVHIGVELERRVPNAEYLGDMNADIDLGYGNILRLTHEGSASYALSYSLQKRINALEGGTKPNVLLNGHIHKAIYMYYRNIHAIESATLESQTEFMAMKGTPAHVGFWVVDITHDKDGVRTFTPTLHPYY